MSRQKEQRVWDTLKANLHGRLLLKRVENTAGDPLADVIGQNKKGHAFWLELKAIDAWPSRATTKPLARAFEPGQVPFAKEWNYWGGSAFILLRVGNADWLLLHPNPGRGMVELVDMNSNELCNAATATGVHNIIEFLEDI